VIATSPLHMRVKLNMTPEQVIDLSIANSAAPEPDRRRRMVGRGRHRSEMDYLCRIVEAVIKAGRPRSSPRHVGYTTPEEYTRFMRTVIERVPNSDKAYSRALPYDLGMAVANSLAGIAGGARRSNAPSTHRRAAGNAALEEVVMAINVRNDMFPCGTISTPRC